MIAKVQRKIGPTWWDDVDTIDLEGYESTLVALLDQWMTDNAKTGTYRIVIVQAVVSK